VSAYDESLSLEAALLAEDMREKARSGLLAFTRYTFPDFEINWHHRELCRVLNRFARGEIPRLIICAPPRHGKSQLVSRHLPAFILGQNPNARIIATSYGADLASMMNRDVQRIIDSPSYQELFPATKLFEIVGHRGMYRSAGVGGAITGMGGSHILVDDPLKSQKEADSPTFRNTLWDWYKSTLYTRLEKNGSVLVTVTRWHEDDLVGRLLDLARNDPSADQWVVVSLPALAEGGGAGGAFADPRPLGEPLWPNKYSAVRLAGLKASVGSRAWASLYQQRPAPEDGMIIKREWWRFWQTLPASIEITIQSWDLTFTKSDTSDFVVGVVFGRSGANLYLLDMVRGRLTFTETVAAIKNLSRKWPGADAKYVEEAANGFALIDSLRAEVPGLIAVRPTGSKVARANAVSPRIEAGNVWLPDPKSAPWVNDVVEEWASFPAGAHDDIVDAMTQAITRLANMATDWLPLGLGTGGTFFKRDESTLGNW
jgi:predicted phage terminase large subunit-like protein